MFGADAFPVLFAPSHRFIERVWHTHATDWVPPRTTGEATMSPIIDPWKVLDAERMWARVCTGFCSGGACRMSRGDGV